MSAPNQAPLLAHARADAGGPEETPQVLRLRTENRVLKALVATLSVGGFLGVFVLPSGGRIEVPSSSSSSGARLGSEFLATATAPQTSARDEAEASGEPAVPEFFDARQKWLGCGTFVVDQGQCGGCWSASAANVLGDRVCIHLLADGSPVPLPESGAYGAGALERMFQQAGKCIGTGTMGMAHEHGCKRGAFFVSPQALVSCGSVNNTERPTYNPYPENSSYVPGHTLYPSSSGCNGGEANDAWRYFHHEGLTAMDSTQQGGCTPYTSGLCSGQDPQNNGCHPCNFDQCDDTGLKPEVFTVDSFGWIMEEDMPARGHWKDDESFDKVGTDQPRPASQRAALDRQIKKMQVEMMTNGPLHTCIDVYTNFPTFWNAYPQGIYNGTEGSPKEGGHCIELMGWGTDHATGMEYWTWKNSWGTNFANGGYGRIIRGVDLLGIESDVWVGCPSNSHCRLTAGVVHNETWVPRHAYFPVASSGAEAAAPRRHPTSARQPSRSWPGGKELELSRAAFSHPTVAPLVEAAVRYARPEVDGGAPALARAQRVWSRSVRGLRLRVEVEGADRHVTVQRHMEGHVTVH